jgi:carbon monoxide dehydrogenase subunit G
MRAELEMMTKRSPEEAFDFLADIRNENSWNPRALHIEKTSSGPIGAGTTFTGRYRALATLTTELTDYERPSRFSFRTRGKHLRMDGTFHFDEVDGSTRVRFSVEMQPRGLLRLLSPLMSPMVRRQNAAAAASMARALETATD